VLTASDKLSWQSVRVFLPRLFLFPSRRIDPSSKYISSVIFVDLPAVNATLGFGPTQQEYMIKLSWNSRQKELRIERTNVSARHCYQIRSRLRMSASHPCGDPP
jgi:hypothetical protein